MKDSNNILLALISILADGKFHSIKKLEKILRLQRVIIDYHIKALLKLGIDVSCISKKGYKLYGPMQLLNKELIKKNIKTGSIMLLPIIDSTNQYLFDRLNTNTLNSGDICIAEYQQFGRGRYGRKWFSPFGTNLYFSMYWYFKRTSVQIVGLSSIVSVILAKKLSELSARKVRVKWPNDLYLFGRKLAGILVESKGKIGDSMKIVIGIGINLSIKSFQQEKSHQGWIGLEEVGVSFDRNMLSIQLIKELRYSLESFEKRGALPFLSRWKKFNNFVNQPINLIINNKEVYGISRGIDANGSLLLEKDGGVITPCTEKEVSLQYNVK